MTNKINILRCRIIYFLASVIIFSLNINSIFSQGMKKMNTDTSTLRLSEMEMQNQMLPMAFFTHMGIPLNVGTFGLRLAALQTQDQGKSQTELNFQLETGLSKTVGLFIGGEGLFKDPTLEAMVQFLVLKSKDGMSGFSPIIEFEFPVGKSATRSMYTLVGFSSTISNTRIAFNQVIHYSPLEDLEEGSASFVLKVSRRIFLVSEISGIIQKGEGSVFNLLGGVKVKINKNFYLGLAYQMPLTANREYSSRYVFQPNIMLYK